MLKCNQIIELKSKQQDTKLFRWQRIEMKIHFWMCKTCRNYAKQLNLIQKLAVNIDKHQQHIRLSTKARIRIQEKLKFFKKKEP